MTTELAGAASRGAHLQLEQLTKLYPGGSVGVDRVDLSVGGGEILALLGPSGCGKTTTLRMIAGLIQPTSGDILMDGASVISLPVHRRNLGMLFQNYALFPHMNVLDNVGFGLSMRGMAKRDIERRSRDALQLVQLETLADRMPRALSGGQQQRVALARAIVYQPRLLLLDEPFAALDRKLREAMQIELRALCTQLGLTTILVTHDQEEALVLADRIAVMRAGRIEQIGAGREVYDHPATAFVANFIGTSNLIGVQIVSRDGQGTRLRAVDGTMFQTDLDHALPVGGEATMSVRPESVTLFPGDTGPEGGNVLEGIVAQSVFKGQTLSVWLKTAAGADFICTISANRAGVVPKPGERWQASWAAERTVLVPRQ